MNTLCDIIDPRSSPEWDSFVKSRKDATFFHTTAWVQVLCDSYGFTPRYITLRDKNSIIAGLPVIAVRNIWGKQKAVSLPFSDFCGPLCDSDAEYEALLTCAIDLCKKNKWNDLELRGGQEFLKDKPEWSQCFTHSLDLTKSESDLLAACRDSTRRNINKARNQSIKITHETTMSALHEFYRLNVLTRREHGLPPQPWFFFEKIQQEIIAQGKGFILLAKIGGKFIAGNMFLIFGKKAYYKYGASDIRYQHLRPNNLVLWEGIKKCREYGCEDLNFGRTEMDHTGLLQFKRGFGCSETTINYYLFKPSKNRFIKRGIKMRNLGLRKLIFSRIPISILRIIGNHLYKYVG
jgi:Uncharacterized protein involved in methicillin resistance